MPRYMGYKPSAGSVSSPMGEPRVPKPRSQGDAKSSGPGSGTLKPALRSTVSRAMPARGRLVTRSIKSPGSGTRGSGRTHNSVKRT